MSDVLTATKKVHRNLATITAALMDSANGWPIAFTIRLKESIIPVAAGL